jgi:nitrogen fixation/metabolism regulation signal transduction histidine kinase
MNASRSGRGSLRDRLLVAFVLVGVPPVLLLAAAVTTLMSRSFDQTAARRLDAGLRAVRARIAELERRADAQVALVAAQDLPATVPTEEGDLRLAETLGRKRELAALEIVDAAGRVVSSRHWPAGYALEDRDRVFPGGETLRVEKVASGHGAEERLALMPAHPGTWRGAPVTVRGGPFLDGEFLADLGATLSAEVGLRDEVRHVWIAPAGSPLGSWAGGPGPAAGGEVVLGGAPHHWAAAALGPALSIVVAFPRADLDLAGRVRGLTLGVAGVALVAALGVALWLSGRIAWPVGRVADAARRVAGGDLDGSVPVTSRDEIGDLAAAFNTMTAELRVSRERAVQAERVAAWREMARRLAHELKNPLFPIQLSIETLRRNLDQEGPPEARPRDRASGAASFAALFRESSDTILDALRSLRRIVDEFAEFARMPRPEPRPTDVNAVVEKVLALHRAGAGPVRMESALSPGLPAIAADPDLLARALGNLVRNALEAMPQGGTLNVRTASRDGTVSIEVEDDGPGITEEQRTRLFVPYFTTKRGGTGLGLAIVQGIVSDHGGRVEVRSAPGAGTTFTLILPAGRGIT